MSFTDKFFTLKSTCHLERPQAGSPGASTQPWPLRWGWWGKGDLHPKFQESSFQKVHRHRANISNHVHVLQRQPRGSLTSWMGGKMESRASRKVIPVAFPSFLLTFQLLNMGMWMLDYASLRWAWRPWQPNYSWSSWCRLSHPWWSCGSMQHCGWAWWSLSCWQQWWVASHPLCRPVVYLQICLYFKRPTSDIPMLLATMTTAQSPGMSQWSCSWLSTCGLGHQWWWCRIWLSQTSTVRFHGEATLSFCLHFVQHPGILEKAFAHLCCCLLKLFMVLLSIPLHLQVRCPVVVYLPKSVLLMMIILIWVFFTHNGGFLRIVDPNITKSFTVCKAGAVYYWCFCFLPPFLFVSHAKEYFSLSLHRSLLSRGVGDLTNTFHLTKPMFSSEFILFSLSAFIDISPLLETLRFPDTKAS